ncbi:hypothetical protein [Tenacibaculum finnmarkense]|uniref:hypothetical protein n=1 Tax=Tenacibaculum finnmarkense TaxID=2781243 RepID=UPI001EFB39A9|nr:hypothetical protein [Tenacibaculum finnmarkense]MCG8226395.1 hypothetical protein [Tenacibaculum finnmarkense genomovar finnmarkense]
MTVKKISKSQNVENLEGFLIYLKSLNVETEELNLLDAVGMNIEFREIVSKYFKIKFVID